MRPTLSLFRREFSAYFTGPVGYVALFGFLLLTGLQFNLALSLLNERGPRGVEYPMQVFLGGADTPTLAQIAGVLFWGLFPAVTGIITMRLLAEERGSGTLEMLLTAPIRDWQVVFAKFAACFAFYLILWLPTLAYLPVLLDLHAEWKAAFPFCFKDTEDAIQPQYAIRMLYELTKGEAIITTGVGQHQMWAAQYYEFDEPRTLITSAGLGSMGYGYPSALGAKVARPDKQVIDIDGDGSFVMNIQELACARVEHIGAKAMVLNNLHLGMVVQWEDRFYKSNRGHTFLGLFTDEKRENADTTTIYPDFMKICEGFGVPSRRVIHKKDLRAAMEWFLAEKGACVLEVMVPYTEHVLPMIPAGATYKDVITEGMETLKAGDGL